jgi:hypothetical protein
VMTGYQTQDPWTDRQFDALVVACSDGRFNEHLDEFLRRQLAIACYDRLYVPGGAGALATSGAEFLRAQRIRADCQFLIKAHSIKRAILIFHGPAADGPTGAVCGDYLRRLPTSTAAEIRLQQERDARQLMREGLGPEVRLELYRCEVTKAGVVRFEPVGAQKTD